VLLQRLAKKNSLDMILVDVGPSSSLFNAWLVTSCDYILPPAFADKFSALSIRDFIRSVIPSFRDKQAYWLRSMWLNKETIRRNDVYLFNPLTVVLPFALGKIALNNADGTVTAACAKWVLAIQETLSNAVGQRIEHDTLMKGTLLLQDYLPVQEKHYCTFLKELKSEMPVSQQLRIPLVSLEPRHLTKMGQAKDRVKYIQDRYHVLTTFLLTTWAIAPLREGVVPQILITLGSTQPKAKKQKLGPSPSISAVQLFDDKSAALNAEPPEFKLLLQAIYKRAAESAGELGLTKQHGFANDEKTKISEDELTNQMVNGAQSLSQVLHDYSKQMHSSVHHQKRLDEGRPDIVLANVTFPGHSCSVTNGNLPIVVEVKKLTYGMFNSIGCRKKNTNQVRDYRNELTGATGPSPYSVLLNFELDTLRVQLLWSKFDEAHPLDMVWH